MAIDERLLDQILTTPESRDVRDSPAVATVLLQDPSNAAALVPALDEERSLRARNARRVLCLFDASGVPPLVHALGAAGTNARYRGLEVLYTIMSLAPDYQKRETIGAAAQDLQVLLRDKTDLPDWAPPHVERDFTGRVCDLAFLVLQSVLDPKSDQSVFRGLDDDGRNQEIEQFVQRTLSFGVA